MVNQIYPCRVRIAKIIAILLTGRYLYLIKMSN